LTLGFDLIICRTFLGGWTLGRPFSGGVTDSQKNVTSSSSSSRFDESKEQGENSGKDDVRRP
jgi:hypothetical protein